MNNDFFKYRHLSGLIRAKSFRMLTLRTIGADCLAVLAGCAAPLIQKNLIDAATSGNRRMIWLMLVLLAGLIISGFGLRTLARLWRSKLSVLYRHELQRKMFDHLMLLPEGYLQSRGAGYFFNRLQHDISEVVLFIAHGGMICYPEGIKLLLAFGAVTILDWRYALLMLPFIAIQSGLCLLFRPRQFKLARKIQEKTANERHTMQELMNSHRLVKTHNSTQEARARIDAGLTGLSALMNRKLDHDNLLQFLLQLPVWACGGLVVLTGLLNVANKTATLGQVWALLGLLMLAFAPVRMLGNIFAQAQAAEAAWQRLRELWAIDTEKVAESTGQINLKGDIEFDQVTFAYSQKRNIIENLNLHVPGGSGVFITGTNGSGKSTLLALLLRLFDVHSGRITVGGINIKDSDLAAYRSRIGYIGQQPEFFKGSLRENLCIGSVKHPDDKLLDMFRELHFEELLKRLPHGLDTQVSERGDNFSGGEKLRLALVRELLRDTDILLFDEPAANLDAEGRQQFYKLLQHLPGEKTVLAVVHDLPENCQWQTINLSDPTGMQA